MAAVVGTISMILILFICMGMGLDELASGLIAFFGALFAMAFFGNNQVKKTKSLDASYGKNVSYDPKTETLSISAKYASIAERLTFKSYISTRMGYTPEKLIYTSATVGGVTTDGVDKVGGYGTETQKTSRYNLFWSYLNSHDTIIEGRVKKIRLSKDLVADAKSSKIKPFVKYSNIVVEDKIIPSQKLLDQYADLYAITGEYSTYYANTQEDDIIASLPTKDKCQAIINWLSNRQ